MKRLQRFSTRRTPLILAVSWAALPIAYGQSVWNAATGDWATPTNWTPAGVPNGVTATIANGGTATVSTVVAEVPTTINVGSGGGTSGRLDIVAGSLGAGSATIGENSGSGILNIANTAVAGAGITGFAQGSGSFTSTGTFGIGGTLITPTTPVPGVGIMRLHTTGTVTTGDTLIGVGPGGDGKVFMESGTWNSNGPAGFGVGVAGGVGLMNMSGGNLAVSVALAVGYANGTGVFNLADTSGTGGTLTGFATGTGSINAGGIHLGDSGALGVGTLRINTSGTITSGVVRIGETGSGTVLMDAGVWTNSGNVRIGANTGGVGTFTIGGGSFTSADEIRVATAGSTGTLNVQGGSVSVLVENGLNIGRGAGALGTMNLSGGTVQAGSMNIGFEGGNGTVNISGGELTAGGGTGTGYINVGADGSTGKVLQTGGKINIGTWMAVGLGGAGPQAEYHISGGEVLGNAVEVGSDRAGLMTITGTANVHPNVLEIATRSGGIGNVILNSPTAVVTLNELSIGSRNDSPGGSGVLDFQAGALNAAQANIGRGGPATYNQSGSLATIQRFYMGNNVGAATANLTGNGSLSYEEVRVGFNGTGPVTLNIADNYVMQGKTGIGDTGNQHWGMFNAGENLQGPLAINQTGGTVAFSAWMSLGIGAGPADPSVQTYTISGGLIKDNRDQPDPRPQPLPDPAPPDRRFAGIEVGSDHGFTMNVLPGATINVQDITTGHRANGNGVYNQSGGQVTVNGWMWAGREGKGTVNVTGGNLTVAGRMYVGDFNVAVGEMNVNYPVGSTDQVTVGELRVAANANITGTVNVKSGKLKMNGWMEIGRGAGSNGTVNVDGPNAILDASTTANQDGQVGIGGGTGNLNIKNGGQMIHNWWVNIARDAGSVGQVTVDGPGSKLTNTNGRINVGEDGTGTLNVTNGGLVDHALRGPNSDAEFVVGRNTGGIGVLNISDAASRVVANYDFRVGASPGATGTVNITGGTLKLNGWTEIGRNGGTGTVNIVGPTAFLDASETRDNYADNYAGNNNPRDFQVGLTGDQGPGNGTINIQNGGQMTTNWWLNVARGAGSVGVVNVDGAGSKFTNTNGQLNIGENGVGTLNVTNGGVVDMLPRTALPGVGLVGDFIVGRGSGSQGVVNLSGADSRINTQGWAYIGLENGSNGTVNHSSGTFNAGDWLVVGNDAGATGQYNLTGGTVNVTTNFLMGRFGNGKFVQTAGTMNVGGWVLVGADPSGRGEYDLVGGTFTQNHPTEGFVVGRLGNADNIGDPPSRFSISNAGELIRIGGGAMIIGEDRHGNGLLEVKNGGKMTNPTEMNVGIGRGNPNAEGNGGGAAVGRFVVDGGTVTNGSIFVGRGRGADPIPDPVTPGAFIPGPSYAAEGTMDMIAGSAAVNGFVRIGTEGATGTFNMTGGTLTSTGEFAVGVDGVSSKGTAAQVGGLIHTDGDLVVGRNDNAQGTLTLDATARLESVNVYLGQFGTASGTLVMNGGTLQAAGDIVIAADPATTGGVAMSNGVVNAVGNLIVGQAGTATLNHLGGTMSAQNVFIGDGATNTPTVSVTGLHTGPVDLPGVFNARSALTVRSGTLDVDGLIAIETGTNLEVTGPTVLVNVAGPAGTATDGVLRATSNQVIVNGTLTVDSGLGVVRAGLSGTTVRGNGVINADLNMINGATLAPGNSVGNLSVTGDLVFDSSAIYSVEIEGGSLYDSVTVNGNVTLAGAQLSGFTPTPLTISSGQVFYIVRNMGAAAIDGIFAGAADGSTVSLGIWTFQISYDADFATSTFDTGGNDIALKALIPEPASIMLLTSGVALMLVRRRRRDE